MEAAFDYLGVIAKEMTSYAALRAYASALGVALFLTSMRLAWRPIAQVRLVEARLRQGEDPKQDVPSTATLGPLGKSEDAIRNNLAKLNSSRLSRLLKSLGWLFQILLFGIVVPTMLLAEGIIFYPWFFADQCVLANCTQPGIGMTDLLGFVLAQLFHASPADALEILTSGPSAPDVNPSSYVLIAAILAHRFIVEASIAAAVYVLTRVTFVMWLPTKAERERRKKLEDRRTDLGQAPG